jgi:hypothetical protein
MERRIADRTILDDFCESFCKIIDKYTKYIVCSGFVAIAHGRSRGTEDIDMIVEKISLNKFIQLHEDLSKNGFVCMQSDNPKTIYEDYLNEGPSVRYVWKSEGYFPPEMEIKFTKDVLDAEQINQRTKLPLTNLDVYFSSIESNIAFKEEFLGTEKDLEDARHLRIIYKDKFDEQIVKDIKNKIRKYRPLK